MKQLCGVWTAFEFCPDPDFVPKILTTCLALDLVKYLANLQRQILFVGMLVK